LWLVILLVVAGAWSAGARSARAATPPPAAAEPKRVLDSSLMLDALPVMPEPETDTRVDLYGNEIEQAIGDYRVDFHGDIYERHSPETAVADLSAPSL
jgi:hypothetical protein